MKGDIDMDGGTLRAVGVDTATYTYNAAHNAYDDLSGVVGAESGALTDKTFGVVGTGVFDATDATLSAVTGDTIEAVVVFLDTGTASADLLILYLELSAAVTPNGGDITLQWNASGLGAI
jgi:hypothetical protein